MDPYKTIKTQNESLQTFINNSKEVYDLERNQFVYKVNQIPTLDKTHYGLYITYWVVFAILIIVLLISKKMVWYIKLIIAAIFASYPFFIYALENAFYKMLFYSYCVITGESYSQIENRKSIQNPKNFPDITNVVSGISKIPSFVNMDNIKKNANDLLTNVQNIVPQITKQLPNLNDDAKAWVNQFQNDLTGLMYIYNADLKNQTPSKIKDTMIKFGELVQSKFNTVLEKIQSSSNLSVTTKEKLSNYIVDMKNATESKLLSVI
jgi:hypothetical protein